MLGRVFKAYDIRATYPNPLNEATAWKIGYGTARFLLDKAEAAAKTDPMLRHIVVGRDMRKSSPALTKALVEGMRSCGAHVIDVGQVDTPFIYFAVNCLDCAGGVQTTASHNPAEYNGFKISGRHALPVGQETGLDDISKYAAMADLEKAKPASGLPGRYEQRDLWPAYRDHVRSFVAKGRKTPRIVIDASNGMAATMVHAIFEGLRNVTIYHMNFDNKSGTFAHEPNPLIAANLEGLRNRVLREKADFGVCFDGDADRGIFVDHKARIIGCDHLTALLAGWVLESNPGAPIVYDLRSSKAVEEAITAAGGVPIQSKVGHVYMKQQMREKGAVLGGELSGHFYFRDNFCCDSGAIVLAMVLSLVSSNKKRLADLITPFARYAQSGEINFQTDEKDETIGRLGDEFASRGVVAHLDGVSIDCFRREGWWCNVRKSNTEPLLRLNMEAKSPEILKRRLAEIEPMLGQRVEH